MVGMQAPGGSFGTCSVYHRGCKREDAFIMDLRASQGAVFLLGMPQNKKVALVTGASTGIGRATVVALAGAGFDVAVNYARNEQAARETADLAQTNGAQAQLFCCDVADDAGVRAMLAGVEREFGRLD